MIKAYEIESKEAIYPRIVISNCLFNLLDENKENSEDARLARLALEIDTDNRAYVWQLMPYHDKDDPDPLHTLDDIKRISSKMRQSIGKNSYYLQKYAWWAKKINDELESLGIIERLDVQ